MAITAEKVKTVLLCGEQFFYNLFEIAYLMNRSKYISQLFFAGFLLISFIGIPVNDHFCGGSFITTTIGLAVEDPCGDMPMEGDCCADITVLYSVTDYFSSSNTSFINKIAPVILICNFTACIKLIPQTEETEFIADHGPPPIESKIFIEIQSFLL